MREISCENCKFFKLYSKDVDGDNRGDCRKKSPIISLHGASRWPIVTSTDWCGDFEKSEKAI